MRVRWFHWKIRQKKTVRQVYEWPLIESVEQALQEWRHAQHLMELSEGHNQVDEAVYHLRLVEKRYAFLLDQARKYQFGTEV